VLKSFFDGGGDDDRLILSGIAAKDDVWLDIETDWLDILGKHAPTAKYMHMVEAIHLRKEFDRAIGWDDDKVSGLLNLLLSYLSHVPKHSYCQFSCAVDLNAYRKLRAETYQMNSPAELCLEACVSIIIPWYFFEYKGGMDLAAHYYFDVGEPFEEICRARWTREIENDEKTASHGAWHHIKHVGPAQMRGTPGLQVADMLSWSLNREVASPGQRYSAFAVGMKNLMPTKWMTWDEKKLRKEFRPLIYKPYGKEQF
jgi:hypothetical protein